MADEKAFLEPAPPYEDKQSLPLASKISREHDTAYTQPSGSRRCREFYFYKGNGFSPKASIQSSDGAAYTLIADINKNKPSSIQLQEGKGSSTGSIGTLTFPPTHNDFQIRIPQMSQQMVQVQAKVGHPHPSRYEFSLPAAATQHPRKVVWKRIGNTSTTEGYRLHDDFTNELIASWSLTSGTKHQIVLKWHVEPNSYWEEVVVMLSFLGVVSRLKLRGKDRANLPSGMLRYNGFWFMAILGTATMA